MCLSIILNSLHALMSVACEMPVHILLDAARASTVVDMRILWSYFKISTVRMLTTEQNINQLQHYYFVL